MKKIFLAALIVAISISCGDKEKSDKKEADATAKTTQTSTMIDGEDNSIEDGMDSQPMKSMSGDLPMVDFDKREFLFGNVQEGEVVKGSFVVKNTGKADLLLTSVRASCGCTVPKYTKEPIKPGESGIIDFSFNTKGRSGTQSKSITVKSNSEKETEILRIKGVVEKKAS